MPYFANTPEPSIDARDRFIGNGVTKVFSPLSRRPSGQGGLLVMVNGIVQDGLTYGFAANTLTFKNAPPAPTGGAFTNIEVVYLRTSSAPQSVRWTTPIGSNSGTSDALAINYAPVVSSLTNNLVLRGVMTAGTANTSSVPTFSPNGLTAKTIINNDGSSLVAGQIAGTFELRYDLGLDKWVLLNQPKGISVTTKASDPTFVDNSTKAASTDWVRGAMSTIATAAGFASNLSTTGYIKFPSWLGSLIIQWGLTTTISQNSQITITLPIAFTTAGYIGMAMSNNSYSPTLTDAALQINLSTTQITIGKGANGGSVPHDAPAYWFVIGK